MEFSVLAFTSTCYSVVHIISLCNTYVDSFYAFLVFRSIASVIATHSNASIYELLIADVYIMLRQNMTNSVGYVLMLSIFLYTLSAFIVKHIRTHDPFTIFLMSCALTLMTISRVCLIYHF